MLTDKECPQDCAFRGVTKYISAAHDMPGIGWGLAKGQLFPVVLLDVSRGDGALFVSSMVASAAGASARGGTAQSLQIAFFAFRRLL